MRPDPVSGLWFWAVLVVVAAFTMAFKLSFVEEVTREGSIPPWASRALQYVPSAVIAALVTPAFFAPGGGLVTTLDPRLVAGAAAAVVAWRTESVLGTLAVGMGTLWAFEVAGLL